eukprot:9719164-Prorocentrum_lima.AAC.1
MKYDINTENCGREVPPAAGISPWFLEKDPRQVRMSCHGHSGQSNPGLVGDSVWDTLVGLH